ncbi:MAG: hypothetical protein ACJ78Q_10810, partial [Chloroflexia bacterium]
MDGGAPGDLSRAGGPAGGPADKSAGYKGANPACAGWQSELVGLPAEMLPAVEMFCRLEARLLVDGDHATVGLGGGIGGAED